jgi:hypothetical protein
MLILRLSCIAFRHVYTCLYQNLLSAPLSAISRAASRRNQSWCREGKIVFPEKLSLLSSLVVKFEVNGPNRYRCNKFSAGAGAVIGLRQSFTFSVEPDSLSQLLLHGE